MLRGMYPGWELRDELALLCDQVADEELKRL